MPAILIAYDIKEEQREKRDQLREWVEERDCVAVSESCYVLNTSEAPTAIHKAIDAIMGTTEGWWMATLHGPHGGRLPTFTQDWLKRNVQVE